MRWLFWVLCLTGLLAPIWAFFFTASPDLGDAVLFETLDGWFAGRLIWAVLISAVIGGLWSIRSYRVRFLPDDSSPSYQDRVLVDGMKGMLVAASLVLVMTLSFAATFVSLPMTPFARISGLMQSGRSIGVLLAALPAFGIAWGLALQMRSNWTGRGAPFP